MKQVKIAYDKCKKKMPNRPPDEIDFGLGFRAALRWVKTLPSSGTHKFEEPMRFINEELE